LINVVFVQTEFLSNLFIGKIDPKQIQTDDPFSQGLVMMGENCISQIIKVFVTSYAVVALPILLLLVHSTASYIVRLRPDTPDAFGPAHLTDTLVALCVVNQIIDLGHLQSMLFSISSSKNWRGRQRCLAPRFSY
jgi:hypothetical protein